MSAAKKGDRVKTPRGVGTFVAGPDRYGHCRVQVGPFAGLSVHESDIELADDEDAT